MFTEKNILEDFGKKIIKDVRDKTIRESLKTVKGEIQDKISQNIYRELKNLSSTEMNTLSDLVIDCVDGALNNFLWLFEQEDQLDLIAYKDNKSYSLKKISGGISVDYWNFLDSYSGYKRL